MVALKARHLAMLVPGIFVVLVGLAMAFGRWNTERGRRFADLVGGRVSEVGSGSGAEDGRAAGAGRAVGAGDALDHDPSDRIVRGTTIFRDLADWGVDPEALRKLLGGEPGAADMTVREWCAGKGIGFGTVKAGIQRLVDAADS